MILDYQTVAFIMDIPIKHSKEVFKQILGQENVTVRDKVNENMLVGRFGKIKSMDPRYDGTDKFNFYLDQRRQSYRNYLNEKSCVKNAKFTGKFKLFYQILTQEEIDFCNKVLEEKNRYIYKKKP